GRSIALRQLLRRDLYPSPNFLLLLDSPNVTVHEPVARFPARSPVERVQFRAEPRGSLVLLHAEHSLFPRATAALHLTEPHVGRRAHADRLRVPLPLIARAPPVRPPAPHLLLRDP